MSARIGVLGSGGFVGTGVVKAAEAAGVETVSLPRVNLPEDVAHTDDLPMTVSERIGALVADNQPLVASLEGVASVVNAAGLASPTDPDFAALWRTNVLLPAVLDALCAHASVQRVVHVSSAAVQSDMSPLNENAEWRSHSPYAESKAVAERFLLDHAATSTAVYRATSVMGADRAVVQNLIRLYSGRVAPIFGDGTAPLPLSALPNTGAALVTLALSDAVGIVLQPWEGVTQESLARAIAGENTRLIRIPTPGVTRTIRGLADRLPGAVVAQLRRLDLLVFGQEQDAHVLTGIGYEPAVDATEFLTSLRQG